MVSEINPPPEDLPQRLGLFDTTTVVVGSMVGSGIFLKASGMAAILPDPRWLLGSWVLSGLLTLFGALALAELGSRFPRSGGAYVYLKEVYGPRLAFVFGWSLLLVLQSGSIAGLAAGIVQTLAERFQIDAGWKFPMGATLVMGFTLVNIVSVRLGVGVLQNVLTILKSAGMIIVIFFGLTSATGSMANLAPHGEMPTGLALLSAVGVVMMKALWAYDGWINATFVSGEVKNAQKNLPRALSLGSLFVIALYVLINLAYHYGLSLQDVQASKSVAVSLAVKVAGAGAGLAVATLIVLSMAGTLNSSILSAPRVYFAMARDGLFFEALGRIHPTFQTPAIALLTQGLWALVLLKLWGGFERITDNVMFVFWMFYALAALAIFLLPPPGAGHYRAPARKLTAGLFLAVATFLILNTVVQQPVDSAQALVLLAVGWALYPFFASSPKRRSLDR